MSKHFLFRHYRENIDGVIKTGFNYREMNSTDINEEKSVKLVAQKWADVRVVEEKSRYVFIGDIHGDLHQLLNPLVKYGILRLTGNIDTVEMKTVLENIIEGCKNTCFKNELAYMKSIQKNMSKIPAVDMTVPEIVFAEKDQWKCDKVIILGDVINEWINSRVVAWIIHKLLLKYPGEIIFIYGNHDARIIGNYPLFINGELELVSIPPLWCTLKKEMVIPDVFIRGTEIVITGKLASKNVSGYMIAWLYVLPIFYYLHDIYTKRLGHVCYYLPDIRDGYICSHTFWSPEAVKRMVEYRYAKTVSDTQRRNYFNGRMYNGDVRNYPTIMRLIQEYGDVTRSDTRDSVSERGNNSTTFPKTLYQKLVDEINDCFYSRPYGFYCKSLLLSCRFVYKTNTETNIGNIILDFIAGHTYPDECSDIFLNTGRCLESKLLPQIMYTGGSVYFFDMKCSAGYDIDSISHPVAVSWNGSEFQLVYGGRYKFGSEAGRDCLIEFSQTNIYEASDRKFYYLE